LTRKRRGIYPHKTLSLSTKDLLVQSEREKRSETCSVRMTPTFKRYIQSLPRNEKGVFVHKAIRHELLNKISLRETPVNL